MVQIQNSGPLFGLSAHGSAVLCQLWGPCGLHPGPGALWFLPCPHQSPLFFSQTEAFADVPLSELWPSALLRSIAPGEDFWPPPVCSTPKCQFPAPQPTVLLLDPVDSSASASFLYILMKVDFNLYSYGIFLSSISTCFVCFCFIISKVGTLDFEEGTAYPQASGFRIDVYNASDSSLG